MDGPNPNPDTNPNRDSNAPTPELAPADVPTPESVPTPELAPESVPTPELAPESAPAPQPAELRAARKRARARHDPLAHRRGEPRTFAILWMLFMVAAIMVSLSPVGPSGLMSVETYRPSARLLGALMAMGIAVVWPMIRLSQVRPRSPGRAVTQDLVVVMVPIAAMCAAQAAPWMAGWPTGVGAAMVLGMLGWSMLVAGILLHAFATEARRDPAPSTHNPREPDQGVNLAPDTGTRVSAMLLLMAISIAGPLISALGYAPSSAVRGGEGINIDWAMMTSPVGFALEIARDRVWTGRATAISSAHWWGVVAIVALGAAVLASANIRSRRAHV